MILYIVVVRRKIQVMIAWSLGLDDPLLCNGGGQESNKAGGLVRCEFGHMCRQALSNGAVDYGLLLFNS
jgi:hypothetical protein